MKFNTRSVIGALVLAASPSTFQLAAQASSYSVLGDLRTAKQVPTGALLRTDSASALIESVTGIGARIRVRFGDVRLAAFATPRSLATGDAPATLSPLSMRDAADTIILRTAAGLDLYISRHPLRITIRDSLAHELLHDSYGSVSLNSRVAHYTLHEPTTRYYALGEQPTSLLSRNGTAFPFWNTDRFNYAPNETPIYSTLPFYIAITNGVAHGVLYDNPFRGEMDFAGRLPGSIGYSAEGAPDGGELRYYVIPGPSLDSVLARFTRLTGRMPLPPRWALGYHQSRYSYAPDTLLMNVARNLRSRDIPADVLYLDIDYMHDYRVFTWSPTAFSHPKATLDSLRTMGFKVVAIVDPGVKVDSAYSIYRQGLAQHAFLTTPNGNPALGTVWPGVAAYPDFTKPAVRTWWGNAQSALVDPGVRGIWNDMNEPASFSGGTLSDLVRFDGDGHPGTHAEYHNQYGTLMARASFEGLKHLRPDRRPFVITRAAYTGVQRYSSVWTGDNRSTWEHLRLSIPMVLSLGLSGEPFAGSDIGGFAGTPSAELYARWLQAAALIPLFRTHSAINVPRREPWSYGPAYERANRATIRLRYRLLPAVYSAFHQHTTSGAPVVRPIFWNDLSDTLALNVSDEYFLGDHLLAAPVVDSLSDARTVYLPRGRWYRIGTDSAYDGKQRVKVPTPEALHDGGDTTALRGLPLFARAGAVIPMQTVLSFDGARPLDTLELHVWPTSSAPVTSSLYEDAGDGYAYEHGDYRANTITTTVFGANGALKISFARDGKYAGAHTYAVTLHSMHRPRLVRADGHTLPLLYDADARLTTFAVPAVTRTITITP